MGASTDRVSKLHSMVYLPVLKGKACDLVKGPARCRSFNGNSWRGPLTGQIFKGVR